MNEIFKIVVEWLKSSPRWCKIVAPLLAGALAIVYLLSSCGVTRAKISNFFNIQALFNFFMKNKFCILKNTNNQQNN